MKPKLLTFDSWPDEARDAALAGTSEGATTAAVRRGLALLQELHAAPLPPVQADLRHALDTWRWVRRLDPAADDAVQLAALFHDVERLFPESGTGTQQHANDYQAFKDAHAERGAQLASQLLATIDVPPALRHRVVVLIARHERPPAAGQPDGLALLRDADALSFFSCSIEPFRTNHDVTQTRRKVAWTQRRMSPAARRHLDEIPLRPDLRELVEAAG